MTDKAQLRTLLREARAKISPQAAEAAAQAIAARALAFVLQKTIALDPVRTPVALYAALPGELDCAPLLTALAARKFPTLLPVAGAKATPLASGRFGLREPGAAAPEQIPKIVFAPLLGFDGEGTRLGFGGGYYDSTLAHLRREGTILAGGLAFSCQRAEKIPREKHDEPLDFVVTEADVFQFTDSSCAFSSSAT
jgi:5-formyltetrahydrofolate cyclo-ligase